MAIIKPDLISKNQIQIVMGWDLVSDFDRGALNWNTSRIK